VGVEGSQSRSRLAGIPVVWVGTFRSSGVLVMVRIRITLVPAGFFGVAAPCRGWLIRVRPAGWGRVLIRSSVPRKCEFGLCAKLFWHTRSLIVPRQPGPARNGVASWHLGLAVGGGGLAGGGGG